jgi:D-tyrosyl-tRNA(Tyr) deacylase
VSRAEVRVGGAVVGKIAKGFTVLVGFTATDTSETAEWMAEKVFGLRLFLDGDQKMNLSLADVGGEVLVVSQFTLYGNAEKGRRPSFIEAARPEHAIPLYEKFIAALGLKGLRVATGEFGAMMEVELVNEGPTTIWIEK